MKRVLSVAAVLVAWALAAGCGRSAIDDGEFFPGRSAASSSSTCTRGAVCQLGSICAVGVTECVDGSPVCIHQGNAADGSACGDGGTCHQGSCGTCTGAGAACQPPNAPCVTGTLFCSGGQATCMATGRAPDGAACGDTGTCNQGSCIVCSGGGACVLANLCHVGVVACQSGVSTCVDTLASLRDGTPCGSNSVCSGGQCVGCSAGQACTPQNPCHTGITTCSSGVQACVDTSADRLDGTACGTNATCRAGACVTCVAGASCTPVGFSACAGGITICTNGPSCLPTSTTLADGTPCGTGQFCAKGLCEEQLSVTAALPTPVGETVVGSLGTVTDVLPMDSGQLAATVDWGDGTTSTVAITVLTSNEFSISGSHTYARLGMVTATITVRDPNTGGLASASASVAVGGVTEYPFDVSPTSIAAGPDGNLWLTQVQAQVTRITPQGGIAAFFVPTAGSSPQGITAGPDGNLWFADIGAAAIGRITPAGAITEFLVPTAGSQPYAVAAGADGNLWFTDIGTNQIGRVSVNGAFAEFGGLVADAEPFGIASGPDGNVWFTELGSDRAGRITPSGVVSEFLLAGQSGVEPWAIAVGPDGNLWIGEGNGTLATRMTTDGTPTTFPAIAATAIALGPDGNLWLGSMGVAVLGRLSTDGSFVTYSLDSGVTGIVAGPDGALWVAETDRVVRVAF